MQFTLNKRSESIKVEVAFLNMMLLLFIFRTAIPLFKYPFILLYVIWLGYFIVFHYRVIINSLKHLLRNYSLVLSLIGYLVISFLFSDKLYIAVFKDIFNVLLILSLFFMLDTIIDSKAILDIFLKNLVGQIIIFSFLIALVGILDTFVVFYLPDSAEIDYNIALLPVLFGTISALYMFTDKVKPFKSVFLYFLIVLFSLRIFLAGSRRGLFIFAGIALLLILIKIILILNKRNSAISPLSRVRSLSFYPLLTLLFVPVIFYLVILHSPQRIKEGALEFVGSKNKSMAMNRVANSFFRYTAVVNKNKNFTDVYSQIWSPVFDPNDPESGWGYKMHKTVFPLTGGNVEIVPKSAKGYYLDKSCESSTWEHNANSYTRIWSGNVEEDDGIIASVYCFVSEDFDGDWIRISSEGATTERFTDYYDLNKRGTWQKLNISPRCIAGEASILLYLRKFNCSDLSLLKGHVIFAYPEIDYVKSKYIFDPKNPDTWASKTFKSVFPLVGKNVGIVPEYAKGCLMDSTSKADTWNGNAYSFMQLDNVKVNKNDSVYASVYCYVSEDFDGSWVTLRIEDGAINKVAEYDLNNKGYWQQLKINTTSQGNDTKCYLYFAKYGVTDFLNLRGYIIYAYPYYGNTRNTDTVFVSEIINSSDVINTKNIIVIDNSKSYASLISLNIANLKNSYFFSSGPDIIRRAISKFISEDTTYKGYKSKLHIDTVSNEFIIDRTSRWKFALDIYLNEYSFKKKIVGGGFNFLNWFGFYFLHDKTASDWPHNPFLSILLYSGLIGLVLYIFLIYTAAKYYIRYLKEVYLFFIFFIISFFFTFFSGGSPFDPPVMGFFMLFPFLISSVHRKIRN